METVDVKHIKKDNYFWYCSYCGHMMEDKWCKPGYTVTCFECKKEYIVNK